ncbi:MAG: hypothetical protein F4030_10000 [Gammaproteobacteria bacterium]|nr:hypothetical protein [Gammaproteobacteria bacterium]MYH85789.1 hypothetical protein [Gammaproteobacteria bacterium]MYK05301.1 hypothetical protein [Gammaproteobacteria bacterium]
MGKQMGKSSEKGNRLFEGIPENADQFDLEDNSANSAKLDIVVGIDLGTSSTKVVVHAPHYAGNPAFAVHFGGLAHKSMAYLLPTRLFVRKNGLCSLAPSSEASVLTEIKLGLMRAPMDKIAPASGPSCGASATTVATAYLALVLRYVRRWFIANKREIFGGFSLNWSCNLGLPAAIDDDIVLRETFRVVGKAAWLISRRPEPITIDAAKYAIGDIKHSRFEGEDMPWGFELIPEVIAEVTGYARSQFRNEGLHLLVDIGASTLDICSFILHEKKGNDNFTILTAQVGLLGAKRLHLARIDGAKSAAVDHAANLVDEGDPASKIPDDFVDYAPSDQEFRDKIADAEEEFKNDCKKLLYRTLADLRTRRDPHSPRWSEMFPVFVCGGATVMQMYQEVVSGVGEWLQRHVHTSNGTRLIRLPKPESLEAEISDDSYHRLAVAWGLSHESFNIGTYTRPSEIEDVPPKAIQNVEDAFISKDMV